MHISSITRRIFQILCVALFFSCASSKTEKEGAVPLWIDSESMENVFPQKDFLARVAFSDDADSAQMRADSELSLFFNTQLKVRASADEKFSNRRIGENNQTGTERNLNRTIELSSESELVALRHTNAYFDKARKKYAVCAYINRNEAWRILEPKLRSVSAWIEECYRESQNSAEPFRKIILLNSALNESEEFYHLYFLSSVLVPRESEKYASYDSLIQNISVETENLKSQVVLSISVSGDESGKIETKLREIFSKNGFSVASANAPYQAKVSAKKEIAKSGEIFISYPHVFVSIEKNGEGIASWAKQFPKVSSYTEEACERMIANKIENELEHNFIGECLNIKRGKK